jgi:hypothetical protein
MPGEVFPAPTDEGVGSARRFTNGSSARVMSALPPEADIRRTFGDVRFVPLADIMHRILSNAAEHDLVDPDSRERLLQTYGYTGFRR